MNTSEQFLKLLEKFFWFCEVKCPLILLLRCCWLMYKFVPSIIMYILAHTVNCQGWAFTWTSFLLYYVIIELQCGRKRVCGLGLGRHKMRTPCVGGVWAWIQFKPPLELLPLPLWCEHCWSGTISCSEPGEKKAFQSLGSLRKLWTEEHHKPLELIDTLLGYKWNGKPAVCADVFLTRSLLCDSGFTRWRCTNLYCIEFAVLQLLVDYVIFFFNLWHFSTGKTIKKRKKFN